MNLIERLRIFGFPRLYVTRRGRRVYLHLDRWIVEGETLTYRKYRWPRWPNVFVKTIAIEPEALAEDPAIIEKAKDMLIRAMLDVVRMYRVHLDGRTAQMFVVEPTEDDPRTLVSLKVSER